MEGTTMRILSCGLSVALLCGVASAGWAQQAASDKTLYERLGGIAGISVVVDDFIDRLVVDHLLNENPAIKEARQRVPPPYLKYHVTAMVCQATGGPCVYNGRPMRDSHAHLGITEVEWDQMAAIFQDVLDDHRVPAAEQAELFAIVGTTRADIVTAAAPVAQHHAR
jgi:hemoglobin